jgi:hypothetical protein
MSNQLRNRIKSKRPQPPERGGVWCLSKDDWNQMAGHLMAAEQIFKKAEQVSPAEWAEWTSEFSEGQGFPSIIYRDKPVIIRPVDSSLLQES